MIYNSKPFPLSYIMNEEYKYHKSFCKNTKAFCRKIQRHDVRTRAIPLYKLKHFIKIQADQKSFLLNPIPNTNPVCTILVSTPIRI